MIKQRLFTTTFGLLLTLAGALAAPARAGEAALAEAEGVIHAVELASNTLVINGVRYRVAYDASVEIRGSYGAFSMLEPGMKVVYEYRVHATDDLEIFDIEQLPDNSVIEET